MYAKVMAVAAVLALATASQAAVLFTFETGLQGWTTNAGNAVLAVSATGATEGVQAMSLTASGFGQVTADLTTTQWAEIVADKGITFQYTIPAGAINGSWGGWWGQMNLAINSTAGGWQEKGWQTTEPTSVPQLSIAPGVHTATFDLSALSIPADAGGSSQIWIQHNWGFQAAGTLPSTMYLDNFQTVAVPEPTALAVLGFASLGLVRRRRH